MELTVLGIAWKRGPCTTYGLMKELAASTSTYYKSRAGTTYPLVARLLRSGLLAARGEAGARGDRELAVTAAGLAALREWLESPVEMAEVANTADFVRLRVFYLGALPPEGRRTMVDRSLEALREHRAACERMMETYRAMGDAFSEIATLGVLYENAARTEWLTAIRSRLEDLPASAHEVHE